MGNVIDAHWFPLASQGNVYSMTKLSSSVGSNKLLVASLKRKIYSCEYNRTPKHSHLRPMVKELLFTYIPSLYIFIGPQYSSPFRVLPSITVYWPNSNLERIIR